MRVRRRRRAGREAAGGGRNTGEPPRGRRSRAAGASGPPAGRPGRRPPRRRSPAPGPPEPRTWSSSPARSTWIRASGVAPARTAARSRSRSRSDAVDRVDARERPGRLLRLVRLQVADQVPAHRQVGGSADLLQRLLDPVLAEVLLAGVDGGPHALERDRSSTPPPGGRRRAGGRLGRPRPRCAPRISDRRAARSACSVTGRETTRSPASDRRRPRRPAQRAGLQAGPTAYFFSCGSIAFTWAAYWPSGAFVRYASNAVAASGILPRLM